MTTAISSNETGSKYNNTWYESDVKRHVFTLIAVLALLVILAGVFIHNLAETSSKREIDQWAIYLDALLERRLDAVDNWLMSERSLVQKLAENTSVRLYLTQRVMEGESPSTQAQENYLANLLNVLAARASATANDKRIKANIDHFGGEGLALLDDKGTPIVTTGNPVPLHNIEFTSLSPAGLIQPIMATGQHPPLLQILMPIFAVQGDTNTGNHVGYAYATIAYEKPVTALLYQPGDAIVDTRAWIAKGEGEDIRILLGTADDLATSLQGALLRLRPHNSGRFSTFITNQGETYIALSRAVADMNWAVLLTLPEKLLLGPIHDRRNMLIIGLGLFLALTVLAVLLFWRHGASIRVTKAMNSEKRANQKLAQTRDLLRLISNKQHVAIFILNHDGVFEFVNEAARRLGNSKIRDEDEYIGKSPEAALGTALAHHIRQAAAHAQDDDQAWSTEATLNFGKGDRQGRLDALPIHLDDHDQASSLILWDDLTELIEAREKREQSLQQLLGVLTGLLDARDPHSAAHSKRVAKIARALSDILNHDQKATQIIGISALVMNLGKVLIPTEILTKPGALSDDERAQVRTAMTKTSALLESVHFDGPVSDYIEAAVGENDNISEPAAILRTVNAFVGMISPRSHRKGLSIDEALATLRGDQGRFDHKTISALSHYMDNKGGRDMIADWEKEQAAIAPLPAQ